MPDRLHCGQRVQTIRLCDYYKNDFVYLCAGAERRQSFCCQRGRNHRFIHLTFNCNNTIPLSSIPEQALQLVVSSTGTEMFERPQEGGEESRQLVCQTGDHQRNPGQNSPVTD